MRSAALRKYIGLFVAALLSLYLPGAAAQSAAGDDALAPYRDTGLAAKIAGRKPVATWVRGVVAYPSGDDSPSWYVDSERRVVGTRDGLFELKRGKLMAMSKADTRAQQRRLAARTEVPPSHIRVFGDPAATDRRELLLFTAFDCGPCRELEEVLQRRGDELKIELHYLFDSLDNDEATQQQLRNVQCAAKPFAAFERLADGDSVPATPHCTIPLYATGYAITLLGAPYVPYLIDRHSGQALHWDGDEDALIEALNGETAE
ncbi:hypothetical protein DFR29_111178 [Tahibacter aquaticus]|uniref:Thiol:disulfide interchange protein DsbC n=1 Tax=Tahibacter aquaticus TaxID=520092 RepID=A0A4V3DLV6_9GAMM|nr:hypothetical protein [Tahibacter aquaticus]TDR41264.1 hypothetical protein DFR29_111178 [Tahibacter aquaticus]